MVATIFIIMAVATVFLLIISLVLYIRLISLEEEADRISRKCDYNFNTVMPLKEKFVVDVKSDVEKLASEINKLEDRCFNPKHKHKTLTGNAQPLDDRIIEISRTQDALMNHLGLTVINKKAEIVIEKQKK